VKINPLLPHVRNTLIPTPLICQGTLNDTVASHPPVPLTAPRGEFDLVSRDAEGQQMPSPGTRSLPLLPIAKLHTAAEPLVEFEQLRIAPAVTIVVQPTDHIAA